MLVRYYYLSQWPELSCTRVDLYVSYTVHEQGCQITEMGGRVISQGCGQWSRPMRLPPDVHLLCSAHFCKCSCSTAPGDEDGLVPGTQNNPLSCALTFEEERRQRKCCWGTDQAGEGKSSERQQSPGGGGRDVKQDDIPGKTREEEKKTGKR